MSARLEATLYGTPETSMADAVKITITEPGPIVYAAKLTAPARLSDALTAWQTLINASALVGTYSLTWDATAQAVAISAIGPVSFEVAFGGNLHSALGFSAATAWRSLRGRTAQPAPCACTSMRALRRSTVQRRPTATLTAWSWRSMALSIGRGAVYHRRVWQSASGGRE